MSSRGVANWTVAVLKSERAVAALVTNMLHTCSSGQGKADCMIDWAVVIYGYSGPCTVHVVFPHQLIVYLSFN